jgi:signal transduction histidine kinase
VALGNPAAVARILRILVDNAAAYGAGTVTLAEEREHIFGRFVRGSGAAGAVAGAGLGLSIARGLARAMGGELEAAPVPRGARLVLTLRAEGDA